ncbi:MAG: hypothetical protein HZB79_01740 [Deltaproteobacteria bacterium]|nr:hypothetical protein [Deltaproteobacteria bacterium]
MNELRSGAGAVVAENRLYIVGGIQGKKKGVLTSCEWAEIDKNGMLGKFNKAANLVIERGFITAVEYNGWIYAIGGANGEHGSNLLNTVERAKINPDGSLGAWILEKNKMFSSRRGVTGAASMGYIYAIGGFNGEFLDTVERAKVLKDGSLDKWELVPQIMQERRYIHGSAIAGKYIYAIGGHKKETGGALNNVEWSKIDEKGELTEWKDTSPINIPRFLTGAIANKGYVFVVGGYDGNYIDAVETAKINPDGSLSKWNTATPLSTARASMAVASYKEYIYVIGGATAPNGVFLNTIERAAINNKGEIGNWN